MSDIQAPNGFESNETIDGSNDVMEVYQPGSGGLRRNKKAVLNTLKTFFQKFTSFTAGNFISFDSIGSGVDSGVSSIAPVFDSVSTDTIAEKTALAGVSILSGIKTDNVVYKTKIIDIGDWDMDTDGQVSIAHGITYAKIRSVSVSVRGDADISRSMFGVLLANDAVISIATTNIVLSRVLGGQFDSVSYSATSYNRGWITIIYEA